MPVISKELLAPAVYFPPGGPLRYTKEDLEEMCRATNAMMESGRCVPVPLEHQDDAIPLSLAEKSANRVLHNSGWTQKLYMKDGSLWADLEILNPDVEKALKVGTIRHVSPEIRSIFPADGQVHRNVITHVALTCQPVWKDQTPFYVPSDWVGDDGALLAAPAMDRLSLDGVLRLSLAQTLPPPAIERFSYHVPKRGLVVFRGKVYEGRVPKQALAEGETADGSDAVRNLLHRLTSRDPRSVPRAFASVLDAPPPPKAKPQVSEVSAHHLAEPSELFVPFKPRDYPAHEPVLVWEGHNGVHLVDGHDAVDAALKAHKPGQAMPRVATVPVEVSLPEEASAIAALVRLMEHGRLDDGEIKDFLKETELHPDDVIGGLAEAGFELHPDDEARIRGAHDGGDEEEGSGSGEDSEEEISTLEPGSIAADDPGSAGDLYGEEIPPIGRFSMPFDDYAPGGGEKPDVEEKGGDSDMDDADDFAPAEGSESSVMGGGENDADIKKVVDLLTKAGVHLPDNFVSLPEKERTKALLHALEVLDKAGVFDQPMDDMAGAEAADDQTVAGTGTADAGAKPPPLEREDNTMAGAVAMSLERQVADLKNQVKRLSLDREHAYKESADIKVAAASRELDQMVKSGQTTKAMADDLLSRLTKHRLSWVSPTPNAEVAVAIAELNVLRAIPKGTFLNSKQDADTTQLSLEAASNGTRWEDPAKSDELSPERLAAIKKEFSSNTGFTYRNGVAR